MKIKTGNSRIHLIFLKKFKKAFNFCNNDINKFILLLKKVFILMNIGMIGKILIKNHYMKKKNFV